MKIGLITFHFVNNFGGALQAYALQKSIEKSCGVETVIVDYRNWFIRFTDAVRILPITANIKEIFSGLATVRLRMKRLHRFQTFQERYFPMTKRYNSGRILKKQPPSCDKYVCGSDQIWNPILTGGVAEAYFLTFEKKKENKIAYAPSFGISHLKKKQEKKVKQYIEELGAVSVREKDGVSMIKQMTGRDALQLIDPTFLLDKDEWSTVAVNPQIYEKYILLYIMQRDKEVYAYARKLKEKLGLPIVEISRYGLKMDCVDKCVVDVGPAEFLGLIRNAECVCTNSYHGLAFSIIFEKPICLVACRRFGGRMNSLLDLLEYKESENGGKVNLSTELGDREKINDIILREREKSLQYLQSNIMSRDERRVKI